MRISKKVGARLQLAAALIEADNEEIERRKRVREIRLRMVQSAGQAYEIDVPPAPAAPRYASDSAIFAPYRGQAEGGYTAGSGKNLDTDGRPVFDFLGIKLPTEKHPVPLTTMHEEGVVGGHHHLHRNSAISVKEARGINSEWSSRPASMVSDFEGRQIQEKTNEEEAIEAWGVEKFLTLEAKDQIENGRRTRANSTAHVDRPFSTASKSSATGASPRSEEGTRASRGPAEDKIVSKLDLLARIKLYREGQLYDTDLTERSRNVHDEDMKSIHKVSDLVLPSSDAPWSEQLNALSHVNGSSMAQVSDRRPAAVAGIERRRSTSAITGDCWSEQGEASIEPSTSFHDLHRPKSSPRSSKNRDSMQGLGTTSEQKQSLETNVIGQKLKLDEHGQPQALLARQFQRTGEFVADLLQHGDGMAGVGSFSRSAHNRRLSMTSDSMILGAPILVNSATSAVPVIVASNSSSEDNEGRHDDTELSSNPRGDVDIGVERKAKEDFQGGIPMAFSLSEPNSDFAKRKDHSPKRLSNLNPAYRPRLRPSAESLLVSLDPFHDFESLGSTPYPSLKSPSVRPRVLSMPETLTLLSTPGGLLTESKNAQLVQKGHTIHNLSTRQLQEMARDNNFPLTLGPLTSGSALDGSPDEDAALIAAEERLFQAEQGATSDTHPNTSHSLKFKIGISEAFSKRKSLLSVTFPSSYKDNYADHSHDALKSQGTRTPLTIEDIPRNDRPLDEYYGATEEADLSSARWERNKRKSIVAERLRRRLSYALNIQLDKEPNVLHMPAAEDVDDDYTSPPVKGPLRPQGIQSRLPSALQMPIPLEGTIFAPRRRLVGEQVPVSLKSTSVARIPDGFVVHRRSESIPVTELAVQGACGGKPFFMSPEGKSAHDNLLGNFLKSSKAQRTAKIPSIAPSGIGRRAAVKTTALFRNQLVQNEEEMEGWGWDVTSRVGDGPGDARNDEDDEDDIERDATRQDLPPKRNILMRRKEQKSLQKLQKVKQERKVARRNRRRRRDLAKRKSIVLGEMGVEELSPDEDFDLSDTSSEDESKSTAESLSEASWKAEDEAKRDNETRPAGRLYGKSLLDMMEEHKKLVSSKARQYGQVSSEALLASNRSVVVSCVNAGSGAVAATHFRDNPVGYNDTRERMEAAFGPSTLWAAEMAKRKLDDAKEETELGQDIDLAALVGNEISAQDVQRTEGSSGSANKAAEQVSDCTTLKGSKCEETSTTSKVDFVIPMPALSHESSITKITSSWLRQEDDSEKEDSDSSRSNIAEQDAARRRQILEQRSHLSRPIHSIQISDKSSEEEDVPLSRLRKKVTAPTLASGLSFGGMEYGKSDEEELPLAHLVQQRRKMAESMGLLHMDLWKSADTSKRRVKAEMDGQSDDDKPIGLRLADAKATLLGIVAQSVSQEIGEEEEDEDDRPLGTTHPQAALIAEQATLIRQLQAELTVTQKYQMQARSSSFGLLPPFASYGGTTMDTLPGMPVMSTAMSMTMTMPPPPASTNEASIVSWACQVPEEATGSKPHSHTGSSA